MAVTHEHSIHLQDSPNRMQLTSNGVFIALPQTQTTVKVWSLQDITAKPLELAGHRRPVTGVRFGHKSSPTLLCSAAEDYIIVWNIDKARACLDTGQQIRGTIIGKTLGYVPYVAFNHSETLVAVCADREVYLLDAKMDRIDTILEGHASQVNCAEFSPHYSSTLVTASDDRTYKIWNIESGCLVYQSCIISSSPFISLTMNPMKENFALGTNDGQVRVYDLTDGNGFRCLHHFDVSRMVSKIQEAKAVLTANVTNEPKGPVTISSRPSWQRNDLGQMNPADVEEVEDNAEVGCSILAMYYTFTDGEINRSPTPAKLSFLHRDDTLISELLESAPMLVIGTPSAIIQVNARTLEPTQYIGLKDPMVSNSLMAESRVVVSLAGNMAFCSLKFNQSKLCAVVGSLFENKVNILHLYHPTNTDANFLREQLSQMNKSSSMTGIHDNMGEAAAESQLSVLSIAPLLPNSPLKAELMLKEKETTKASKLSNVRGVPHRPGSLSRTGGIIDKQPIIYHEKIKSSGYSKETPKRTMFQPKINSRPGQKTAAKTNPAKPIVKEYPINNDPPVELATKLDVAERPTAINMVMFSDDGQHLACALANTSAQIFKLPLTGKGCAFTGHKGVASSAQWSHDNKWVITSSEDRSAAVWSLGLPDPVMELTTEKHNFGADKEGGFKPDKDNPLFGKPVRFAQFYYMDKFLLLTCGSSFSLYKYHLDTTKSDIKRYLSSNRYKVVKKFEMTDTHQITAFTAVNSFHSYLAFCAGSNKSIDIFDLNVGANVLSIPDVHTRAPHVICQNVGSAYVGHASTAYDLFVTAAPADSIKLWDLRSARCVRRYEGHSNRSQPCGLDISPCSRFIATGSEDRSAYVFDIRSGTYLHKLTGHTDTVSDVAFHPLYPQLLTATLDGKLRLFVNKK